MKDEIMKCSLAAVGVALAVIVSATAGEVKSVKTESVGAVSISCETPASWKFSTVLAKDLLDIVFPEFHTLFEDPSSTFAMELLRHYPTARDLAHAKRPAVARLVRKYTRGNDAEEEAERLVKAAKVSLAAAGYMDVFRPTFPE